jgi:hypothetical protein
MKKQDILLLIAFVLIFILLSINLYIAENYYFLDRCKLPEFYLWQADIHTN